MFGQYWEREESEFNISIKEQVKTFCRIRSEEQQGEHVKTLVKQGEFLQLAESERRDAVWKSFIFDLKKGTMKFYLNSVINTLPIRNNFYSGGKIQVTRSNNTNLKKQPVMFSMDSKQLYNI